MRVPPVGLLAFLFAVPAFGQSASPAPGQGGAPAPLEISANDNDLSEPQRLVTYRGNVDAIQGQTRMRSPEVRIYYKPRSQTKQPASAGGDFQAAGIDHIEAAGPFYYVTPTQTARSDSATYLGDADTFILTGHVILTDGKNVTSGDKLVIERRTGHSKLTMNSPAGRVRAIIYPNAAQTTAEPAPPKPGATPR